MTKIFIYQDLKYKPFMVYAKQEFPYGIYIGHFDTIEAAEKEIENYQKGFKIFKYGIPLCKALIDFRKDHGYYDMSGLFLLEEKEIGV